MAPLLLILKDPVLRLIAALMLLQGAFASVFGPYVAVLAVQHFGLGNRGYAAVLAASTLISVAAALLVGIRADQTANRRRLALGACWVMVAGCGIVVLWPATPAFVVAHLAILPLATLFGQLFAQTRLAARAHPEPARDGILAAMRALFALPFVVVLPLWSWAFGAGVGLLAIYPVSLALALAMLGLTWAYWPGDGAQRWHDLPSGLSWRGALGELAAPGLVLRVLALGAVNVLGTLNWAVIGLVMLQAGRGPGDVALFAGLAAGLEVPMMLALPLLGRSFARNRLILAGTVVYALHLVALPLLAGSQAVWLLLLPASVGAAVILTLPIAYLQDLLAARPGTGSALMALQRLTGDVLAAGCFAIGTTLAGYGLAVGLGVAVALTGAVALVLADD